MHYWAAIRAIFVWMEPPMKRSHLFVKYFFDAYQNLKFTITPIVYALVGIE